jgi:hypothetical protein
MDLNHERSPKVALIGLVATELDERAMLYEIAANMFAEIKQRYQQIHWVIWNSTSSNQLSKFWRQLSKLWRKDKRHEAGYREKFRYRRI